MPRRCIACLALLLLLLQPAAGQTPPGGAEAPTPRAPRGTVPAGSGALPPSAAPADPPAAPKTLQAPEGPAEGSVRWIRVRPAAGAATRLRLRGAALSAVLAPGTHWELVAIDPQGATAKVDARLELPATPAPPEHYALKIVQRSDLAAADGWAVADRGANPPPINRLRITLTGAQYRQPLKLETGETPAGFSLLTQPTLLYQRLSHGDTVTLDTMNCPAKAQRYLRLTLPGGGALRIDSVTAWQEPPRGPVYAVKAALGPMHADAVTGNSIWPLLLAEPRLPLVRFKLSASAESDGEARNVRLVRLDKSSAVVDSSPATAWVQRLKNGTMVHDQRWLDLPPEVRPEAWGIAVADGKDPPVQLKSVDAYAAEVCLTCVQPAQGELRLRVNAAPPLADPSAAPASAPGPAPQLPATGGAAAAQRSAAPGALQAQAVIDGEITALQPLAAATATGTAPSRSGRTAQPGRPAFRLPGWLPVVGFTVPGLLLLLLGTSLLRRPRVMD